MPRQTLPSASRPVAWALLSQAIWLPLLAIDFHERWQARVEAQAPRPGVVGFKPLLPNGQPGPNAAPPSMAGALSGRVSGGDTGILLGSRPGAGDQRRGFQPGSLAATAGTGQLIVATQAASQPSALGEAAQTASQSPGVLPGGFSRAELLGGPIGLADLQAGVIPPLALAEQGRRTLSGDPMAALPEGWREPMRQALKDLPTPGGTKARIESARLIHVPSRHVSAATEVPLALQSDGSVDILSRPREKAVVEEIRNWSSRQPLPAAGSVAPAVVLLHPLEDALPLRPPATPAPASASAAAANPERPQAAANPERPH
jgi:hypothetical protein